MTGPPGKKCTFFFFSAAVKQSGGTRGPPVGAPIILCALLAYTELVIEAQVARENRAIKFVRLESDVWKHSGFPRSDKGGRLTDRQQNNMQTLLHCTHTFLHIL